ncbi:GntR family transcriptional regulator [Plastoroseomonas hellenica]|uniref:GntR family transcriptional regulator n=1 Tax=Plastoroseomonas hellenica TaxID=2687306 RepID=UPI001BAC5333|nr:GntR family transcriptional regulator [Plastoroseomonas hellenica]MBR0646453.1 GntR family transcriptional regulator [Plastoroseomonas hellenica]
MPPRAEASDRAESTHAAGAYETLRARILGNDYAPGQSVSVAALALELGMSRTPLRDALIRLEGERLVELVPRYGFRVLPVAPGEMREIYEVLAGLELVAVALLIARGPTAADEAALEQAGARLQRTLEAGDLDAWAEADTDFHDLLLRLGGNARLAATATELLQQTRRARAITLRLRPLPRHSTQSHRALITAILRRDGPRARELHLEQRLRSARELTEILERLNIRHL